MPYANKSEQNQCVARWKVRNPGRVKQWSRAYIERRAKARKAEREAEAAQRLAALASASRMVERAKVLARIALNNARVR